MLAWDILYFFSVILNNTGGGKGHFAAVLKWREFTSSVMGCGGLGGSQEELLRWTGFDFSFRLALA